MAPSALRPALFIARLVTANTETVLSKALCRLALNALAWPSKGPPSSHPTRPLPCPSTLMKMDPLVLKKVDPPVGPVWRAPTVSGVDLLVANKGRVIVPCQDRSRRRRWPKASLYKGLSPGHARPPEGDVGVRPTRGRPTTIHLN